MRASQNETYVEFNACPIHLFLILPSAFDVLRSLNMWSVHGSQVNTNDIIKTLIVLLAGLLLGACPVFRHIHSWEYEVWQEGLKYGVLPLHVVLYQHMVEHLVPA